MPLQNTQYDTLMRDYDRKQLHSRRQLEERIAEVYNKLPRVEEIQHKIASLSADKARALLMGKSADMGELRIQIAKLSEEKTALLISGGYSKEYLEMHFDCPFCHDTGYINGEKCSCFKQAVIQLLYDQSNIQEVLEKENFQTFSFDYYSDTIKDKTTGKTSQEYAHFAVRKSMEFIDNFGNPGSNLFIYGDTGVGKTFLSHCIAYELLHQGYSVLYFSAYDLFQALAAQAFSRERHTVHTLESVCDTDLLIIDDLGTELTNSFVSSQLFLIVNERLTKKKPTIISTNHDIETFSNVYSTRTFSRIMQNYTLLNLIGKDIRVQKTLGGSKNEAE